MADYAILIAPSSNRVYTESSYELARAELAVANRFALGQRITEVEVRDLAGVRYIVIQTQKDSHLGDQELSLIGTLSSTYAVFEFHGDSVEPLLRPLIGAGSLDQWDDDLISIPRYVGRTNDQFTKLLVNMAAMVSHGLEGVTGRRLRVLDPVCGRGTTINQAVMYGFDAAGIEIDSREVEAWNNFFSTWLKDKRIKHKIERRRLGQGFGEGFAVEVSMWRDKAHQKSGAGQHVVMVAGDTVQAVDHLGRRSVDLIVGDLPYGVQHGSRTSGQLGRTPEELVETALPVWWQVLRPGGAVALSWNTRTLGAEKMFSIVSGAGLEPVIIEGTSFRHRVDRVITRDVIIAQRPSQTSG